MILILQQMWYFNNTQTLLLLIDPEKSLCKPNISLKKTHGIHAVSTTKNQKKTIEESLSDLEKLVAELENGELELDQALKKFEQGVKLSRECQKTLAETEMKIKILMEDELKATDEQLK